MVNSNKLRAKIIENGYNNQTLAPHLSITAYTLGQKISNDRTFNLDEANSLQSLLNMTNEEIISIFFNK